MNTHRLIPFPAITTDCLGHYFMGLGLLRAVSQKWPSARGSWHKGIFWLAGDFVVGEVSDYLLQEWKPTSYKKWWSVEQKADTKTKTSDKLWAKRSVTNIFDIRVSDCTIVPSHRNQFNPIFGTGGNIGKRDLAVAQQNALHNCKEDNSFEWLESSLFGKETTAAPPFANGGSWFVYNNKAFNSGQDWYREGSLSPWSYLLAMEGALLMRGGSGKRFGSMARPYAVFPFISQPSDPDGQEEVGQVRKGEFWAPVWQTPATLAEICYLFQRGLARLGDKAAAAPHEFAVAALASGTDAGVISFVRFEFRQTTSSQVYEAIPRHLFEIKEDPLSSRLLTGFLGWRWFDFLPFEPANRKSKTKYRGLRGRIERLVVGVTQESTPETWQKLWLGLVACQIKIDHNRELRKSCRPLPMLPTEWLALAHPEQASYTRVACVFASLGAGSSYPAVCNIFGIEKKGLHYTFGNGGKSVRTVWHEGDAQSAILDLVGRRLVDSKNDLHLLATQVQISLDDVSEYLSSDASFLNPIHQWVPPLSLIEWTYPISSRSSLKVPICELLAWAFFKPFFLPKEFPINNRMFFRQPKMAKPGFARQLFNLLRQDSLHEAIELALTGYRAQGFKPIQPSFQNMDARRIASALVLSVSDNDLASLINRLLEPEKQNKQNHVKT